MTHLQFIQITCGNVSNFHGATGNLTIKDAGAMVVDTMGIIVGIEPTEFLNLSENELGPYVEKVIDDLQGGGYLLANFCIECKKGILKSH